MKQSTKRNIVSIVSIALFLFSTLPSTATDREIVAVAAGIAPCVEEVMTLYVSAGNEPLSIVKGPCGALAKQTDADAPYGLILLSEPRWPKWMEDRDLLVDVHTFAIGQLVLWSPGTEKPNLSDLEKKTVAIPDPDTTAYGMAAKKHLQTLNMWDSLDRKKVLPAKSAPQAIITVKSGAAEWAFIPESAALKAGGSFTVMEGATLPQVGGLSPSAGVEAKKFWSFCRSSQTDPIWLKWGFALEKRN
ncbi:MULTISPECIES: molybdate ABC transporter substrate-binding protein [Dethiosulfovibrio]|uniref:Molybdate ABC transporter substrate-binding protein n=2 Tax=Dethiosulfovibrio TaxID=47054 RepID=A0ABS9EJH0_9BACT|nr:MULTISPECIES: molybdate ABC transporter substrate-binding protein [Dethiosulfovibrio]MCF4112888.1 molybdate ABC transporter substrate-binding protein [Dethiosulfovibrio russensis]MCF4141352.1 molybdate ABC transporter substrate-binding protein [Dethiosulfovibrio marinus]MCF4145682.1 molybdate ABC transporter substrate-binding protein [Dethiosulfovibrio acidaminovorans]